MFDKTFICKQGNDTTYGNTNKTLHALLRDKQVTLIEGSVQVYFLAGFKADQYDLREITAFGGGKTLKIGDKAIDQLIPLNCEFSMLSELHVVAWGNSNSNPDNHIYGNCVVVVVSGCALISAWSEEELTCNDKLKMTFDIEETNGVLQAKADFDGTITQGIFDKLHDYSTLINKPTIGNGTVNLAVHERLSVSQDSVTPDGASVSTQTFNVNQDGASSLYLGAAALRGVNEAFDGQTPSLDYVPTSSAVIGYVSKLGYITQDAADGLIGKGILTISKGSERHVFSANEKDNKLVTFGTAADANVVTVEGNSTIDTVSGQDGNLITLGQAKTLTQNATSPKTATVEGLSVVIPVGSLVWLAINFIGSVNITMFTTKSTKDTPAWGGGEQENERSAATYIAKLNDHNGDFFTSGVQVPAGYKFRTLNAMEVTGESMPSYGFALCMCIEAPTTADATTT